MKKITALFLVLVMMLTFAACGGVDSSLWQANETFKSVPVYKYGDTISAEFASECNIKINDNNYENFAKYVEDLKKAGFEYVSIADIPENYSISDGSAQWRCSNGEVSLQLIFNENESANYSMFGCNLQIYGYSKMPESWQGNK
ncbi:MAG: hypothetical protein NC110_02800 [Ruminococcus sp.]|nr:hypothetical protein [Ruminococcus sp.]